MATVHKLTAAGQQILAASTTAQLNILMAIWTGSTTAGDTCTLKQVGGDEIWEGRATGVNTYLGAKFSDGPDDLHVKGGVEVQAISSGKVYVYVKEN